MATDSTRKIAGRKSKKPAGSTPATGFVKKARAVKFPGEKNPAAKKAAPARKVPAPPKKSPTKKTAGSAQPSSPKQHLRYSSAAVQPGAEYVLSLATTLAPERQNTALFTATRTAKKNPPTSTALDASVVIGHPLLQLPADAPAELIKVLVSVVDEYEAAGGDAEEKIAAALEAAPSVPSASYLRSMRDHEELWRDLEQEYGVVTTAEYGQKHSTAGNISTYASRHRAAKKIVGVRRQGTIVLPAYQFDESLRPLPAMETVIRTLDMNGWNEDSICLWMAAPTGWLDDRRPADVIRTDPEAVKRAAALAVADW